MNHRYICTWVWLLAGLLVGVSLRATGQDTWARKADRRRAATR